MTIRYADGRTSEAVILSRTENTMRVAIKGSDDVAEFVSVDGAWLSEDLGPVQVEFAWQRHGRQNVIAEADCICPSELASRLIDLLLNESDGDRIEGDAAAPGSRCYTKI
ncbi:MAG: hypothetical protein ABSF25_12670 [Bryobacteraceae bacterium]|jgi:hypothetical protein